MEQESNSHMMGISVEDGGAVTLGTSWSTSRGNIKIHSCCQRHTHDHT